MSVRAGTAAAPRRLRVTWSRWVEEAVRPRLRIVRLLPTGGRGPVAVPAALDVALGLLPVAFVVATSVLVGGVPTVVEGGGDSAAWDRLTAVFLLTAAAFLLTRLLTPVGNALGQGLRRRVDGGLRDEATASVPRPVGIGPLEDRRTLDELSEAVRAFDRERGIPGQACVGLLGLVARCTRLPALVVVIGVAVAWSAGPAVGAAVLLFRYGRHGGLRGYSRGWREVMGKQREVTCPHEVTMTDVAAKEIRVFGPSGWLREWRARITAGFQDFVRFELLARENVGVGGLPDVDSPDAVPGAVHRARAEDVLERLENGPDTQLGKSCADGAELSGGQWRKLALGRTMMRQGPLLPVLDEPGTALDAQAEHRLFEQYATGARRVGRRTGAITVPVSHRFSTVRTADLILVVADDRIGEQGSHDELVAANGLCAELHDMQASGYA